PASTGGYCGDGKCELGESPATCPQDCMQICGDGICSGSETIDTCPEDCAKICGDGVCSADESCESCFEDCGKCYVPPPIEGSIVDQWFQDATPTAAQASKILLENGLDQLIEQANAIQANYLLRRAVTVSQMADFSYRTTVTITVVNRNNLMLGGLSLLDIVPKAVAQNSSEIVSSDEIVVLQPDPVIEFVAVGKLGRETSFSYSVPKRVVDKNVFSVPVVLNQSLRESRTCDKGCDDKNPCTKESCIGDRCVYFLVSDGTPCGYAQKCRKGMCISFATSSYNPPVTLFGQPVAVVILAAVILVSCIAIGLYYHRRAKQLKIR
ncbi:MAG: hypothetical protein PHH08_05070, partial [Candidatus ainarchaeum sp.]|nr:hypothetical protein [Candidatus ainarchaeum sp.]